MPTIQQQINQLKKDKENLNTMLNTMGVETTGNETFTQLTPLVGKIVTDPILQDKSIEITENGTTNIVADEGYDGLYNVEIVTNVASDEVNNMNLFIQEEEPNTKEGIWVKSDKTFTDVKINNTSLDITWNTLYQPIPVPTTYPRVVKIDDYLYYFGGRNSSGSILADAYKYNLKEKTLTKLTNIPEAKRGCAIGCVGTNIYLIAGANSGSTTNTSYKYDILTDTYTKIANCPIKITDMMYATVGTNIYLLGGSTDGGDTGTNASVYKYDTLTDTFTSMGNMPEAVRVGCATVIGTDIYLIGGFNRNYANIKNIRKYDTLTGEITNARSMPKYFGHSTCGAIGNDIYIFGGYSSTGETYNHIYKYSVENNEMILIDNAPSVIYNSGSFSDGKNVYLVGGQTTGGVRNDIVQYGIIDETEYLEDTIIISTSQKTHATKLNDILSIEFNTVSIHTISDSTTTKAEAYYGDGTQWIKL